MFVPNDNVSEPALSHQAYHTYVLRTYEIENQVDLLLFDWKKVNLHCYNVPKLSACLCTLTFQMHYI